MNKRISIPGPRSLTGSLDSVESDSVVVACPPHPQFGGDRHDSRLVAVSDGLLDAGIDCLRFDYGSWDEGRAERRDVRQALSWARESYDRVGLFGFSFGAAMAILAGGPEDEEPTPDALSALAPAAQVAEDNDVVDALGVLECPAQVVYGERDDTAEWEPVVQRARELDVDVRSFPADHFFIGQQEKVAAVVVEFLAESLDGAP